MAAHGRRIERSKAHDIVRPTGWLKVYSSQRSFERTAEERAVMTRRGVNFDVLTSDEIRQLEPGLSPKFTHGYHQPDNGFVRQPIQLTEAYFATFQEPGGSRSEERRVGKACVSKCSDRWSTCDYKKKRHENTKRQ